MTKLEGLDALLRRDPQRANVEMLKHLDGFGDRPTAVEYRPEAG